MNDNYEYEKKTILIVDDEQKIVDLLVHNLTREGYNTIEANDGQTAVEIALEKRPDLILLDVMLPRMDGLTVCKKIKNTYNVLDLEKYEVHIDGKVINLTLREFEVLKFLAQQPGQVVTREALLERVWGYEYYGDIRTVDVTVRRIRERIEKDTSNPQILITKRGVGYYIPNK